MLSATIRIDFLVIALKSLRVLTTNRSNVINGLMENHLQIHFICKNESASHFTIWPFFIQLVLVSRNPKQVQVSNSLT